MAISQTQVDTEKPIDVSQLVRLGQIAANEGDRASAHRLLQQAAMLSPANEQIWQALLQVVDTDDDRYICLHNIVSINPENTQAQQQLKRFQELSAKSEAADQPAKKRKLTLGRLVDGTLWIVEGLVILMLIGLAVVLVVYVFD